MKLLLFIIATLALPYNGIPIQHDYKIYFGTYTIQRKASTQTENWVLEPPHGPNKVFTFRCNEESDCESYDFSYYNCNDTQGTVTICSTDNKDIKITFSGEKFRVCNYTNRYSELSFTVDGTERFHGFVNCSE